MNFIKIDNCDFLNNDVEIINMKKNIDEDWKSTWIISNTKFDNNYNSVISIRGLFDISIFECSFKQNML